VLLGVDTICLEEVREAVDAALAAMLQAVRLRIFDTKVQITKITLQREI